jgi:hypothetical protein
MKRAAIVLAVVFGQLFASVSSAPAPAQAAEPSAVTPWIEFELAAIASHSLNPPRASRALAHVSSAMYLAALAGGRAGVDAVAGPASTVLAYFFPDEAAQIDALASELADPGSLAFRGGSVIGRLLIARRRGCGLDRYPAAGSRLLGADSASLPVPAGRAGGRHVAYLEPQDWIAVSSRSSACLRERAVPRGDERGVHGLPDTDRREPANRGLLGDGAGTATPPGHWDRIAIDLVGSAGWSTLRSALLFAALNTAQADAFIACWDAKYAYWSIRPITAIRRLIDPNWLSYITTPPYPSYVSGHLTTSGAASTVLAAFFPAKAEALAAMAEEAAVSRLYGGIHYRSDNEVGLARGRRIGQVAVRTYNMHPG